MPARVSLLCAVFACLLGGGLVAVSTTSGADRGPGGVMSSAEYDALQHKAAKESKRRDAERRSPEARQRRAERKAAFAALSNAEALDLARREFGGFLLRPLWPQSPLEPGERIKGYVDSRTAIVERPGHDLLVESMALPLLARDDDGSDAPVDLALEDAGEALEPRNALRKVRLPKRLGDGGLLEQTGVRVRPDVPAPHAEATLVGDDKLFYGNAARDTDVVMAATPQGIEVAFVLRSENSPERVALDLELPRGATVALTEHGGLRGAEIRDASGAAIAAVRPPVAFDADREPVAVGYALHGNKLVLDVEHRGQDYSMPILVDPEVVDNYYGFDGAPGGWSYDGWWAQHNDGRLAFNAANAWWGTGLYTLLPGGGGAWYEGGAWGEWVTQAHPATRITRFQAWNALLSGSFNTCAEAFLWDNPGAVRGYRGWYDWCNDFSWQHHTATGWPDKDDNRAIFKLVTHTAHWRGNDTWTFLENAEIGSTDVHRPVLTGVDPGRPAGWTGDYTAGAWLSTRDAGFGLWDLRVSHNGREIGWHPGATRCGNRQRRCANQGRWESRYSTTSLPEGVSRLHPFSVDAVDNTSAEGHFDFDVKIDRTGPSAVELSGPLYARKGRGAARTTLHVIGRDQWSAVRRLEMFVDGVAVDASMPGAQVLTRGEPSTGLPMEGDLVFDPSVLGEGPRRVKVVATDGVSRTRTSEEFTVIVDKQKPVIDRAEGDLRVHAVDGTQRSLAIDAHDNGPAGIEAIDVFVRTPDGVETRKMSDPPAVATSKTHSATFRFDASAAAFTAGTGYREGRHGIRVSARDGAENLSDNVTFSTIVDRTPPVVRLSGPLTQTSGGVVDRELSMTIKATDGDPLRAADNTAATAGLGRVEVFVDDRRVYIEEQPCTQGNCDMTREFVFDPSKYDGGRHDIEVVGTDLAEHEHVATLVVTTPCCLSSESTWAAALEPTSEPYFGDVTGDEAIDLVTRDTATGAVRVRRSDGSSFGPPEAWAELGPLTAADAVAVGDLNGDGADDLLSTSTTTDPTRRDVNVRLSDTEGFGTASRWGSWPAGTNLQVTDVDGDDLGDLVGRDAITGVVTAAYSTATAFDIPQEWATTVRDEPMALGDVDEDGAADLVTQTSTGDVRVAVSNGGTFTTPTTWATAAGRDIAIGDIDADGASDLVTRDRQTGALRVHPADEGFFAAAQDYGTWNTDRTLQTLDVTGDDRSDVVGVRQGSPVTDPSSTLRSVQVAVSQAPVPDPAALEAEFVDPQEDVSDPFPAATPRQAAPAPAPSPSPECDTLTSAPAGASGGTRMAAQADLQLVDRMGLPGVDPSGGYQGGPDYAKAKNLLCRMLTRLKQGGVSVIRMNVWWGNVRERLNNPDGTHRFEWTKYDDAVTLVRDAGFEVHLTLSGFPAQPGPNKSGFECRRVNRNGAFTKYFNADSYGCDDATLGTGTIDPRPAGRAQAASDYGQFVRAAVLHFSTLAPNGSTPRAVTNFALWNEPNYTGKTQFIQANDPTVPDTTERQPQDATLVYRTVYDAGYRAAKQAATDAGRRVNVLIGELSSRRSDYYPSATATRKTGRLMPADWLAQVANTGTLFTDGLAYHPYQAVDAPWTPARKRFKLYDGLNRLQYVRSRLSGLRSTTRLIKASDGQLSMVNPRTPPLYLTEFGYLNTPNGTRARPRRSQYPNTQAGRNRYKRDYASFKLAYSYWHSEGERARWLYGGRTTARRGALELARRAKARYLVHYGVVEGPPIQPIDPATGQPAGPPDPHEDYGMMGDGFGGPAGENPTFGSEEFAVVNGDRKYGKERPFTGVRHPQARSVFCQIRYWSIRRGQTTVGGDPCVGVRLLRYAPR